MKRTGEQRHDNDDGSKSTLNFRMLVLFKNKEENETALNRKVARVIRPERNIKIIIIWRCEEKLSTETNQNCLAKLMLHAAAKRCFVKNLIHHTTVASTESD